MPLKELELFYEIFYIELYHFATLLIAVPLTCLIWLKSRKDALVKRFVFLQSLFILWMVAKVLKTVAYSVELRWFFIVLQYLGVCFIGSAFVMLAWCYVRGKPLPFRQEMLLNVFPLAMFTLVCTNPWHHWFYATYDFYRDTFGPAFYIHMVFTYGCLGAGIVRIALEHKKHGRERRSKIIEILTFLGISVPLIFNILYITKMYRAIFGRNPVFDYTPICYAVALLAFGFAIFKLDLFGLAKVAVFETFHSLEEGVAIKGNSGRLMIANQRFKEWEEEGIKELQEGKNVENESVLSVAYMNYKSPWSWRGLDIVHVRNVKRLNKRIKLLKIRNERLREANRQLDQFIQAEESLAVQRERVKAARNLHDILGHSLVVVISLVETAKISLKNGDATLATQKIGLAQGAIESGTAEMQKSLIPIQEMARGLEALEQRLNKMIAAMKSSGVAVHLNTTQQEAQVDAQIIETAHRAVQEALTNSIKHGGATEIDVFIRMLEKTLTVLISDNGKGCDHYKEGFGLTQMRQRIEGEGGRVTCWSEAGEGFTLSFTLPISKD